MYKVYTNVIGTAKIIPNCKKRQLGKRKRKRKKEKKNLMMMTQSEIQRNKKKCLIPICRSEAAT